MGAGGERRVRRFPPAPNSQNAVSVRAVVGPDAFRVKKMFAPRYFPALLNAVSSPRGALTAVFGMGTGVTPPVEARTKNEGSRIDQRSKLRVIVL